MVVRPPRPGSSGGSRKKKKKTGKKKSYGPKAPPVRKSRPPRKPKK